MSDPLAYFLTWTTYGTWLPGDARGWVKYDTPGVQAPDPDREDLARHRRTEPPVTLDEVQRAVVDATIRAHCDFRRWHLHALNVRTNHVHVVVTANLEPEAVMNQFKAWCSRRLNERAGVRRDHWWTRHGSTRYVNDEAHLDEVIDYVLNRQ